MCLVHVCARTIRLEIRSKQNKDKKVCLLTVTLLFQEKIDVNVILINIIYLLWDLNRQLFPCN